MISTLTGSSTNKLKHTWGDSATIRGIGVYCSSIYNICSGQVTYIGRVNNLYTVNVKCNNNEVLRYGNLKSVSVSVGQNLGVGTQLGVADKYVEFEYCTTWRGSDAYPVRINDVRYYKQDPSDILNGNYMPTNEQAVRFAASRPDVTTTYTAEQAIEFGDNKGE